jgi:hypothetical protein
MFELFGIQQVFTELLAQVHIYLAEGTLPFDEVVEVLIDKCPFLVFTSAHLLEVGEEIGFLLGFIQETELFIDKRLHSDATDSLCFVQHIIVEFPFHFVFWVGIDVDAEVFSTAHLHCLRVTDCRIIIQIQRDAIIPNRSLTNCYFCTRVCHTV